MAGFVSLYAVHIVLRDDDCNDDDDDDDDVFVTNVVITLVPHEVR